ncbi:MAG: 2-C-methyl-D-erythritol 4-phosphate cytidylyltransferase [Proteobacteria bacterium]|nr:2-C-methyl-D-erythritol 4-phosphate cytidylyltransferase [Pseudomonadota bacterium]MBU1736972.1 2-C-methyl-D-erythritol 4-phosphate cytidylyltransferase [Pseudomonadota bacterium]
MSANVTAIIPAGGTGRRMGQSVPKQFLVVAGLPVMVHTVTALQNSPSVRSIILVVPGEYLDETVKLVADYRLSGVTKIVVGGQTRQDSVRAGMDVLPDGTEYILVHDCARPLIDVALIERCIDAARDSGAAIAAVPAGDTLKEVAAGGWISATVDREKIWYAQTPQVAEVGLLRRAYSVAEGEAFTGTDEAALLERIGIEVAVVPGSSANLKITCPEDLLLAEGLMAGRNGGKVVGEMRVGQGFDAHRLVEGRRLVLGGVVIDYEKGLLGHSDADVLVHALMDALLGAAGLGDIGRHFPDSDPGFKGISSIDLLHRVMALLLAQNQVMVNCDLTVIAQEPKIFPYLDEMRENISRACRVVPGVVNIKATTTEKMGFAGRGEGMAAQAVVMIQRRLYR